MRLAVVNDAGQRKTVVLVEDRAYFLADVAKQYDKPLLTLIEQQQLKALQNELLQVDWEQAPFTLVADAKLDIPYMGAAHIFGVGVNYVAKAEDLQFTPDAKPVCFLKTNDVLVGPDVDITYPHFSQQVSVEGELALIIGKPCFEVREEEALSYVTGYTTALDLTAKDVHAENPRFMQISKLFKGSCSFGPEIKLLESDVAALEVKTLQNGQVVHQNVVSNMMFTPAFIVSYLSKYVTLLPGDIILTGTPGSFDVSVGDVAECHVSGLMPLKNNIR
ncbi:MAG: fumarylacetoacetate hydrolase family protein [Solibacillus sp.]